MNTLYYGDNLKILREHIDTGSVDREKAAIGVYLTLEPPTHPMIEEATTAVFYHSEGWNRDFPKLQILTVEDLLNGKQVQLPPSLHTFKQAEKIEASETDQLGLSFDKN